MSSNSTNNRTNAYNDLINYLLSVTQTKICDKKLINTYLSDLNDLDCKDIDVSYNAMMLLANHLVKIVQPNETLLVKSTCQFLINLLAKEIKTHSITFVACKKWALDVLNFCKILVKPNVLLLLQHLLMLDNNINECLELLFGSKGSLNNYLQPPFHNLDITLHAVGCIHAAVKTKQKKNKISQVFSTIFKDIVINITLSLPYTPNDTQYYNKILDLCMKILNVMITDNLITIKPDMIGEILGIVQAYIFYGIPDYPFIKPTHLHPAAMNLPEKVQAPQRLRISKNDKRVDKVKPKKPKNNRAPDNVVKCSSDSDTSDTDTSNSICRDFKLRLGVIYLLQALVKKARSRDIFGYWPQIVATGYRTDARVLTRSILKETSVKVKINTLSVLGDVLTNSSVFLMHAEEVDHVSFITFFGTVSLMIKEIHYTLSLALTTEKNIAVITQLLKCASALVQATPYSRMKPGLVTKLMRNYRSYIHHKDPTVRVGMLILFESLASCNPITQEILYILEKKSPINIRKLEKLNISTTPNDASLNLMFEEVEVDYEDLMESVEEESEEVQTEGTESMSFLVQVCMQNISNQTVRAPVRLQSLKLIGTLAVNTTDLILNHLEKITKLLIKTTEETKSQIGLHACRILEILAGLFSHRNLDNHANLFWNLAFDPIISLLQDTEVHLREAAYDCLGNIGANIFSQLPKSKSVLVITLLLGAARDENVIVKSSGIRALGMLVTIPALDDDTGFLMDLANVVCSACEDASLMVRVKATWTLANLCNCLTRRRTLKDVEPIALDLVLPDLYNAGIKATRDNDNIRCNAVRILGSVLELCPDRQILKETQTGLNILLECAASGGDMKVRWNACRAIGLVLSAKPDIVLPPTWKDQVFPVLCNLICHSPNFKVRTNAAWALSVCNSYGKYVVSLWKYLILAFENSQHVVNYTEYPHRDIFGQQLCLTLAHLALYTELSELQILWSEIGDHITDISHYIQQFQKTILPEKAGDIVKAKTKFEEYSVSANLSEIRNISRIMISIFENTNYYEN